MGNKFKSTDDPFELPPVMRAAPDDLEFVTRPYPFDVEKNALFLRNKNVSKGIVASVIVSAAYDLVIETMNRLTKKQRWPLQFEVRIPPGAEVLVGLANVKIWRELRAGQDPIADIVQQTYKVQGAYYRDPPLPAPTENAIEWLWVFSVPITGDSYYRSSDVMMNLHPSRAIEARALVRPAQHWITFSVSPGWETQVTAEPQPQMFDIQKIDFV